MLNPLLFIKKYLGLAVAGVIGVLVLLLKRQAGQLQKAKVEIEKRDDKEAVEPTKAAISTLTQEITLDAQTADEAEARLRASLNDNPAGPGKDCAKR